MSGYKAGDLLRFDPGLLHNLEMEEQISLIDGTEQLERWDTYRRVKTRLLEVVEAGEWGITLKIKVVGEKDPLPFRWASSRFVSELQEEKPSTPVQLSLF